MGLTFLDRRRFPILASLLLPVLAVAFFSPFYQTNDDVAMRLLAEGNFVPDGEPLPFLMHVNVVIGAVLTLAYKVAPNVPWYDLLMGAGLTAAAAALLDVWSGTAKRLELVWTALFSIVFLLPAFVAVQFSLVGLGCAAAGIATLVRACTEPLERRGFRLRLGAGAALLLFGALVRFEGAVLMIVQGAIVTLPFLIGAWLIREQRPRMLRTLIAAGICCVLIALSFGLNQYVYSRAAGWEEFHEYNLRRSRINEYIAPERITPEALDQLVKQVGWSGTDFTLFRNWFFTDPNIYSLAKVRTAEKLFFGASSQPAEETRESRMKRGTEQAKSLFAEMSLALFFMAAFVMSRASGRLFLYLLLVVVTVAGLIAGITIVLKAPPERIFWPMLLLAASMLPMASRRWGTERHRIIPMMAVLLAGYVTALSVAAFMKQVAQRRVRAAVARQDAEGLVRTGSRFYVLHGNEFPYEDFWRPLRVEKRPFPFIALGVSARTPPVQNSLRRTGRADLPLSLCTERGLLLVAPAYIPNLLTTFMAEHHGMEVRFAPAFTGQDLETWTCVASAKNTAHHDAGHNQ